MAGGVGGEGRGGWVRRKAGGLTGSNQNAGVGNAALSPADSSNIKRQGAILVNLALFIVLMKPYV